MALPRPWTEAFGGAASCGEAETPPVAFNRESGHAVAMGGDLETVSPHCETPPWRRFLSLPSLGQPPWNLEDQALPTEVFG